MNETITIHNAREVVELLRSQATRTFPRSELERLLKMEPEQLNGILDRLTRYGLLLHTANGEDCFTVVEDLTSDNGMLQRAIQPRVVMVVNNPATMDARVVKSAEAVAAAGYDTHVVGIQLPGYSSAECWHGVTYHRVPLQRDAFLMRAFEGIIRDMRTPPWRAGHRTTGSTHQRVMLGVHLLAATGPLFLLLTGHLLMALVRTASSHLLRAGRYLVRRPRPLRKTASGNQRKTTHSSRLWNRIFRGIRSPQKAIQHIPNVMGKICSLIPKLVRHARAWGRNTTQRIGESYRRIPKLVRHVRAWGRSTIQRMAKKVPAKFHCLLKSATNHSTLLGSMRMWEVGEAHFRAFEAKLRELDADIYHSHELTPLLACIWASRRQRPHARVVYDSHELEAHRNMPWSRCERLLWRVKESSCMPYVDRVITVSDGCADQMQQMYSLKDVTVVRNIPWAKQDAPKASVRQDAGLSSETPLIIYIGLASLNRGLEQMLEAMCHVPNAYHFATVGPWNMATLEELNERAEQLELTGRFHVLPKVPSTQLCRYISTADVSVLPIQNACLSYWHCMPNKLFESTLAGLPVVVSDFPDMRAFVEKHKLGVTCNPQDPQDIARALQHVYENRRQYNTPAKAADLRQQYSFEVESQRIVALYETLLRERPHRSS